MRGLPSDFGKTLGTTHETLTFYEKQGIIAGCSQHLHNMFSDREGRQRG